MEFANRVVPDNEAVVLSTRRHPMSQVGPACVSAVLAILGFALWMGPFALWETFPSALPLWRAMDAILNAPLPYSDMSEWMPGTLRTVLWPSVSFAAFVVAFWSFASYRRTVFVVTRRRVLATGGVVEVRIDEIAANMIRGVEMRSGFLGCLFGYGDVVVRGFGRDDVLMLSARDPLRLLRAVESVQV